jgi:phosphoribosylamine--glycine ligase
MNVLVVGGGGREHALVWKIRQNPDVEKIYCAPGNAGIAKYAECVNIPSSDINGLLKFAKSKNIDLTVVGPEDPLVRGIVDIFNENNIRVFGPTKDGAILEGSKVFAKNLMKKYNIPTADYKVFDNSINAIEHLKKVAYPTVVKADGLAAGKGVIICKNFSEAESAIIDIMDKKVFGNAGNKVIIEDCLVGEEASFIAVTDGQTILPFDSSQDHKPVFDNDKGPNTGGMGAYSPAPVVNNDIYQKIVDKVMEPLLFGFKKEGINYKGVLYAGLMIENNEPYVLEFNCRFGDPETQPLLARLNSDLIEIINGAIYGNLKNIEKNVKWSTDASVCVVMASGGYPGKYEKGYEIKGLEEAEKMEKVLVFHAGTKYQEGKTVTNGGRVLGVTGLAPSIKEAIEKTYNAVSKIKWEGAHYRTDIGKKAFKHL